jgi:hypothetical protein
VFIEAEHHAVYERPDGLLLDLTPALEKDPQAARLFLPDDAAVYSFAQPDTLRDNIRHALTQDSMIDEYLRLSAELTEIMSRTPGQGMVTVSGSDAQRVVFISKRMSHLKREIALRYTPQGAPCFCGSEKNSSGVTGSRGRPGNEHRRKTLAPSLCAPLSETCSALSSITTRPLKAS